MKFSGRRTIVSFLLLSTLLAGSAVAASPASAATRRHGPTASEARMMLLINKARQAAHRPGLRYSAKLNSIARMHSAQMAAKSTIFHTKNLAYAFRTFSWTVGGENVGMGPSMDALHAAFMHSTEHRWNNLDKRFHRIGVGVIWRNGVAYITVEFLS